MATTMADTTADSASSTPPPPCRPAARRRSGTRPAAGQPPAAPVMPRTRYQGSKRKLAGWIGERLGRLDYDSVLDAFGGTGSVAYELKRLGKTVTYNDVLRFNHYVGLALIENRSRRLDDAEVDAVVTRHADRSYDDVVERTFADIYFTNDENRWIDTAVANIERLPDRTARAMAYFALFQAALAKRPYNLFHRRNLYMRHADVTRSFGNKVTWDTPFETHFRRFAAEAHRAVFDNGRPCRALNHDVRDLTGSYDLVYIDPPYINGRGGGVNYRDFYHFLEGLTDYERWTERIDWKSKHRRMTPRPDPWTSPATVFDAFDALFEQFADSILVVSYRSDGIPAIDDLERLLKRYKTRVHTERLDRYQYALSTNKRSREVLLIAT